MQLGHIIIDCEYQLDIIQIGIKSRVHKLRFSLTRCHNILKAVKV